jgi:hypothetical protein
VEGFLTAPAWGWLQVLQITSPEESWEAGMALRATGKLHTRQRGWFAAHWLQTRSNKPGDQ